MHINGFASELNWENVRRQKTLFPAPRRQMCVRMVELSARADYLFVRADDLFARATFLGSKQMEKSYKTMTFTSRVA